MPQNLLQNVLNKIFIITIVIILITQPVFSLRISEYLIDENNILTPEEYDKLFYHAQHIKKEYNKTIKIAIINYSNINDYKDYVTSNTTILIVTQNKTYFNLKPEIQFKNEILPLLKHTKFYEPIKHYYNLKEEQLIKKQKKLYKNFFYDIIMPLIIIYLAITLIFYTIIQYKKKNENL